MSPTVSRRAFLFGSLAAGAAGAAGLMAERHPLLDLFGAREHSPLAHGEGVLVVVTLYGGNDGLNTVIPAGDGRYQQGRGALAYQPAEVVHLADGLALHPSLTGMKKLWDDGRLAIVRGVGYPQPDHSHFRSMDIWQSAVPGTAAATGWLGRWLDRVRGGPLRAVSIGASVPRLLAGETTSATAVPVGSFAVPGGDRVARPFSALMDRSGQPSELAAMVAGSGADLLAASARVTTAVGAAQHRATATARLRQVDPGAVPPGKSAAGGGGGGGGKAASGGGPLGPQLELVSTLIGARVPVRAYSVSASGFDTHADEKATHARLWREVDAALTSFLDGLAKVPHAGGVTVVVYSEFGRRVAANASGGTDHGTAGPVFVAGPAVKGGFYGEEPDLGALDDGDLRATTDFRSVYATLLDRVLGFDPRDAIPGGRFRPFDFV